jgi:hypothetical protein
MVKVYFQVEAKFGSSNFLQICCCKQKNLDQRAATKGYFSIFIFPLVLLNDLFILHLISICFLFIIWIIELIVWRMDASKILELHYIMGSLSLLMMPLK